MSNGLFIASCLMQAKALRPNGLITEVAGSALPTQTDHFALTALFRRASIGFCCKGR